MSALTPYAVSLMAVLAAAWLYHGVTEHHWHRIAWRAADRLAPAVPPVVYESRWHSMGHGPRLVIDLLLFAAAAVLGTVWRISPRVTVITLIAVTVLAATAIAVRALSKSLGGRRPERWEED